MSFLKALKDFFLGLFLRNPEEAHKRRELKKIYNFLATVRPSYYRPSQAAVLPGFAGVLYTYCQFLRPVADIVKKTIASSDLRQSRKYFDLLIDSHLPAQERERKVFFSYEGMLDRVRSAVNPEEETEEITREFQSFMKVLESPEIRLLDGELMDMERLVDLCRHDYERLLGVFDPGVNTDNPKYKPEFLSAAGEAVAPELIDYYYIVSGFFFTPRMEDNLAILLERVSPRDIDMALQRQKLKKYLSALNKMFSYQLSGEVLLALLRAIKSDPGFVPDTARGKTSFLEAYKSRFFTQFQRDKERILRERHEDAISQDIKALFGDLDILEVEAYNDYNSGVLAKESPESFIFVKPMRILKTFIYSIFELKMKDSIKRVLVEGYYDNKIFQNNMANVFFQCEHSAERFSQFEEDLSSNARVSIISMKRYIEEARRGKDVAVFLNKFADTVNNRAREILENETNLFNMLAEALFDVLGDFKRSTPELITNIRTLGAAKNKDLIQAVSSGYADINRLVKIMRNFTIVRQQVQAPGPRSDVVSDLEEV
jgi:hypothetical protein